MDKKTQDLSWACLPKEARDEIRKQYRIVSKNPQLDKYDSVYLTTLENIFGHHNLTSDTEQEEMLMVERSKAQIQYAKIYDTLSHNPGHKGAMCALNVLDSLFGGKCLPDEENTPKSGGLRLEHGLEQTSVKVEGESVKVEPKFKVGDKVRIILCTHPEYRNKVGIITSIDSCGNPYVKVDGLGTLFHAPYALEPYTEPETKDMEEKN